MKNNPLRVLGVVALLSVALAWAQTPSATLTWTAPLLDVDGTPVGGIDHYTVTWSRAPTAPAVGTLDVKTTSAVVPVACGSMLFTVTATTSTTATYPNTTSQPAGPVTYVSEVSCAPNPPGALAVH